jgi:hypothetical protein
VRAISATLATGLALLLAGCASVDLADFGTVAVPASAKPATWRGLPIASGQIVVSDHPGPDSLFLTLSSQRYASWIHAGVIVVEDGDAYVYESFGFYFPMPWERPNDRMGGGVRRVSLATFLGRSAINAVYEPPASLDIAAVVAFVREHRRLRTPFDGRFDAGDPSRLYCTEFVARALEAGGAPAMRGAPFTDNRSMRVALAWLRMDSPDLLIAADAIAESRRVALLSARYSETAISAYFELKRELHRRFTADQRLGDVFAWTGSRLQVRPQIAAYFDAGMSGGLDARTLAAQVFGPLDDGGQGARSVAR